MLKSVHLVQWVHPGQLVHLVHAVNVAQAAPLVQWVPPDHLVNVVQLVNLVSQVHLVHLAGVEDIVKHVKVWLSEIMRALIIDFVKVYVIIFSKSRSYLSGVDTVIWMWLKLFECSLSNPRRISVVVIEFSHMHDIGLCLVTALPSYDTLLLQWSSSSLINAMFFVCSVKSHFIKTYTLPPKNEISEMHNGNTRIWHLICWKWLGTNHKQVLCIWCNSRVYCYGWKIQLAMSNKSK